MHLRVVTKTLSEAVREFKKRPIVIVEDIDSVKGMKRRGHEGRGR